MKRSITSSVGMCYNAGKFHQEPYAFKRSVQTDQPEHCPGAGHHEGCKPGSEKRRETMKRKHLSFCLILMSLAFLLPLTKGAFAQEFQSTKENGVQYDYTVNDKGEAVIADLFMSDSGSGTLRLPEKLDGHPLTGFAYQDINPLMSYNTNYQSISIPNSLTQMPSNPFAAFGGIKAFVVADDHPIFETVDGVLYSKPDKRLVAYPNDREGDSYMVLEGTQAIGANAFSDTNNLQVDLPDSIVSIEDNGMFIWRQSTLELPKGLKRIGNNAFTPMLISSVTLPKGIEYIGDNPFAKCPMLRQIKIEGNKKYSVVKGVLYDKLEKRLISYPAGMQAKSYTSSKDTVTVGNFAFAQTRIDEVVLTDKIITIGNHAFSSSAIASVRLPKSIVSIGAYAFSETFALTGFIVPGQVRTLEEGTFSGSALSSVKIDEGVESIGTGAFRFCQNLNTVELPKTLQSIGDEAFSFCTGLNRVKIPRSVEYIAKNAFSGTPVTLEVFADSYGEAYAGQAGISFEILMDSWSGSIEIEDPKQMLDWYVPELIEYQVNQEEVNITWIQTEKMKFTIPETIEGYPVRVIGREDATNEGLFAGNINCRELVIPEGVERINDYCFSQDYVLQKVNLPKSLKSIGAHAFAYSYVPSLQLPAALTEIGEGAFECMYSLNKLTIDKKNEVYLIRDGMIIDARNQQLVSFPFMNKKGSLNVPKNIRSIGAYAFSGSGLNAVTLPDGLEEIGSYAFFSSSIKSMVIPEGITRIAEGTFTGGASLSEISLPAGLISIDQSAFQASQLQIIALPSSLQRIEAEAFAFCKQLETVDGIQDVDFIAPSAFVGCDALKTRIP